MKNILKNLLFLFLLVGFLQLWLSKSVKADAPFDSYDNNISWRMEMAHLDAFAAHLRIHPTDIGYIIFYTDEKTSLKKIKSREQKIKRHLTKQYGLNSSQMVFIYTKEQGLSSTVLQLRDKNMPPPEY